MVRLGEDRSSHQSCSMKKGVLRNFVKFTGKHLCQSLFFNPIQDGLFSGLLTDGGGGAKDPLPKICHTYPTMMKLGTVIPYLKKIQKIYESHDTPLEFR